MSHTDNKVQEEMISGDTDQDTSIKIEYFNSNLSTLINETILQENKTIQNIIPMIPQKRKKKKKPITKKRIAPQPPPQIVQNITSQTPDDNEYEVERIVKRRKYNDDLGVQYQVRWKGYGENHDCWVKEADMSCPEVLEEFKQRNMTPGVEPEPNALEPFVLLEYSSTRLPPEDVIEFEVDTDDVDGLDYGEYISGTIAEFWMKFYSDNYLTREDQRRIAIYSDQFYMHLDKPELISDFDENVGNIFLKDFVFAPINEESHWVLAVICYPALLYETDLHKDPKLMEFIQKRKSEGKSPMIIFLDSFLSYAVNHKKMVRLIRKFVKSEWTKQYRSHINCSDKNLPLFIPKVPQQNNGFDCGIFMLEYFEAFFYSPCLPFPTNKKNKLKRKPQMKNWFELEHVAGKRQKIYNNISKCVKEMYPEREALIPSLRTKQNNI